MNSCRPELTSPISLPSSPIEHWGQEGLPAPLWARKPRIRKPSSTSQAGRTPELGALGSARRGGTNTEGTGKRQSPTGMGTRKAGRTESGSILFRLLLKISLMNKSIHKKEFVYDEDVFLWRRWLQSPPMCCTGAHSPGAAGADWENTQSPQTHNTTHPQQGTDQASN